MPELTAPTPRSIPAAAQRPKPFDWLKKGVIVGCMVPMFILLIERARGTLDINLEFDTILNQFGYLGLVLLLASLACTPLRILFGLTWPARLRKPLGIFGFIYIAMHATLYFKKQNFSLERVYSEVLSRQFILYGMIAFLLLIPLAVTSTNGMIRRLGGKRWQMLHKLAYVIGILGVVHFYLRVKGQDHSTQWRWAALLVFFLGVRVYKYWASRSAKKTKVA